MSDDRQQGGVVRLVDSLARERVLVFGSLPPRNRDLDLLVPATSERSLQEGLERCGFVGAAGTRVRFRSCSPEIVEVVPVSAWGLPVDESSALLAEARPLRGCANLAAPAPHHLLLILARRLVRGPGTLSERHRARVAGALEEDPRAFDRARERAGAWGAEISLAWLESALHSAEPLPLRARVRALAIEWRARGAGLIRSWLRAMRMVLPRPRLGGVVALSGLDGAGKSSQAERVREALTSLGFDVVVAWPAIDAPSRALGRTAGFGRAIVSVGARAGGGRARVVARASPDEAGRAVRERSAALTLAWSTVVSLRGVLRLARLTWPHLLRGRIVICDRYLLDSRVYLSYQYGEGRSYALQDGILRLLSSRPRRGFLLDVPPETASRRQPERTVEQNARRARLYREHARQEGARVIDGTRPVDEVCAEIAKEVWLSLAR